MKYTKIPTNTFQNLVLNAGIICRNFDPATGEASGQIGATSGGNSFSAVPEYSDFGEDIDNCPKKTKELMKLTNWAISLSGTLVTADAATIKLLCAVADISGNKITPRRDIDQSDFTNLWIICDYSDENEGASAGYIAINVMNALNTGGFTLQSEDNGKAKFAFTFEAHFSLNAQDTVPFEVYVNGGAGSTPYISLDTHNIELAVGEDYALTYSVNPSDATITYTSASGTIASVSNGVISGVAAGNTIITASITEDGVTYSDTVTVVVTAG